MADFQIAFKIVHGHEGGYANVTSDKGGETYMGIARRWHPKWAGWVMIDAWKALHGQPRRGVYLEIPGLMQEVLDFYKGLWLELYGDGIKSQPVANLLYDFATNSGAAVRVAQGVLVQMGYQVSTDNVVGPKTLAAVNAADPVRLHNHLKQARIAYVTQLAKHDPSQARFLPNWLARCHSFADLQKKTAPQSSLRA